jgi:hypothetical protein
MRLVKRPPSARMQARSPPGTTAALAVCEVAHSIGDSPAHLCHLGVKIEAYDLTEDGEVRSTGISRRNRRRVYPGSKRRWKSEEAGQETPKLLSFRSAGAVRESGTHEHRT